MILSLMEQHGGINNYSPIEDSQTYDLQEASKYINDTKGSKRCCFHIKKDAERWVAQTSYFLGVDWIIESKRAIYVQPKLNDNEVEIDYLNMLFTALQAPENLNHLVGLIEIDFEKPHILIQQKQDLLSPFLISQFLQIVKRIVQKGLKKSYYTKTENLKSKVKGKVLTSRNIKENLSQGNITDVYCSYQEFGVNCIENKILKKAYIFSRKVMQQQKGFNTNSLLETLHYIHPAFENVSEDIDVKKIKNFKLNPVYSEYNLAIKFALLILKRYSYNISMIEKQKIMTPPFWIDMSKLFELYVYSKLRKQFCDEGELIYHKKAYYQEIDFIINSGDLKLVVDTKYKPQYHDKKSIEKDDARQVCGYARLESVYEELGMLEKLDTNIDCLIIYSHQDCKEELVIEQFTDKQNKINGYVNVYKVGIRLPEI